MKNLFDPTLVQATERRILELRPDSQPHWGSLQVAQTLAHCTSGIDMAAGILSVKSAPFPINMLGRLIKPFVLRDDAPMRRNSPSAPELFTADPAQCDFLQERTRLVAALHRFADQDPNATSRQPHPFFGPLTPQQWAILMYKHLDHHLRQFGV